MSSQTSSQQSDETCDETDELRETQEIEDEIIDAPVCRVWDRSDAFCSEYGDEMLADLFAGESSVPLRDYMAWQVDLVRRMRKILVNWLMEVHHKFRLAHYTLFLGINLLDRYLCVKQLGRADLQLCGSTCLWIASKYNEIYAPTMDDFVFISDGAFKATQLCKMEMHIMAALRFRITVPTMLQFGERYSRIATHYLEGERERKIISDLILFCLEHCLVSYKLSRKAPSLVAAAALLFTVLATNVTSMHTLKADGVEHELAHALDDIKPVMADIYHLMLAAMQGKNKAVYKKWSSPQKSKISKLKFDKLNVAWLNKKKL